MKVNHFADYKSYRSGAIINDPKMKIKIGTHLIMSFPNDIF